MRQEEQETGGARDRRNRRQGEQETGGTGRTGGRGNRRQEEQETGGTGDRRNRRQGEQETGGTGDRGNRIYCPQLSRKSTNHVRDANVDKPHLHHAVLFIVNVGPANARQYRGKSHDIPEMRIAT